MKFAAEKSILPAFPKTPHLPHKPNTDKLDSVASTEEATVIFTSNVNIEEKIDGASCGMVLHDGEPLIRNRDHILRKGYVKNTAAKKQFASVWNWFYDNKAKFEHISNIGPYSVYGEWCIAQHGIAYDNLPDWFVAYDLYDYEKHLWLSPIEARPKLDAAGFATARLILQGSFLGDYANLEDFANMTSTYYNGPVEGIYLKVYDKTGLLNRFKMVRESFIRGALWNPKEYTKNRKV
jgi:atypical dual specificity phosphatase